MMTDPTSHGLWEATAPAAPDSAPLSGSITAPVAIIGGGFTGLSAALHLAEQGVKAVVLEAASVGFGGSGRNVGLVNAGLWLPPDQIEATLGSQAGGRLTDLLGRGPGLVFDLIERHAIQCEATRSGTLHLAHSRAGLRDIQSRCDQLSRRGAPVTLLSAEETVARVGSQAFLGALHDARAGTIQPLAYARGLAAAAVRAGATLHTGSPVTAITRQGSNWHLTCPGGHVTAEKVILATNAYSGSLFPALTQSLAPIHYFQAATRPLSDNLRRSILPGLEGTWDTATVMTSYRMDAAGRLIIGSIGRLNHPGGGLHRGWAERRLRRIFPQLGDITLEHHWFGRIAMTPDNIPRCYAPEPGVIALMGYNGRGISPGTTFGKCLAAYTISGNPDDLPLPLATPRTVSFREVREAAYEAGAVAFHAVDARL